MKVLVACEYSGIVRDAFIAAGHTAWSVDLLPTEGDPANERWHYEGDVFAFMETFKRTKHSMMLSGRHVRDFDLMIAHPPCTRLTNSGVRWLAERDLWQEMREGAEFFNKLRALPIRMKCLENPIMHKYARELCGPYSQTIQPWQFGEPQFKRTCFWLDNLPFLKPTEVLRVPVKALDPEKHAYWSKVHRASPGPDRAKIRSAFFPGVAKAMAEQWGNL